MAVLGFLRPVFHGVAMEHEEVPNPDQTVKIKRANEKAIRRVIELEECLT